MQSWSSGTTADKVIINLQHDIGLEVRIHLGPLDPYAWIRVSSSHGPIAPPDASKSNMGLTIRCSLLECLTKCHSISQQFPLYAF